MQTKIKRSDYIFIRMASLLLATFLMGWGVITAFIGELPFFQQAIYSLTLISVAMSVFAPIGFNLWDLRLYDRILRL